MRLKVLEKKSFTSKLHLFINSGNEMMHAIENKLKDFASIPSVTEELVTQLTNDAKADVYRAHTDVGFEGGRKDSIRLQIEKFLKSTEYSKGITFYRTLDGKGKPVKVEFTKDDFRGYDIIIFGKIKSSQFKQSNINELLNSGNYFTF